KDLRRREEAGLQGPDPPPGRAERHRHRHLPGGRGLPDRPGVLPQVHLPAVPEPAGKATGGTITSEGALVDEAHIDKLRQKMGMVCQHFNLFPHMTVKQNLEMAPVLLKLKSKEEASKRADELLARVGLSDKADVYPASLSGGQQQ